MPEVGIYDSPEVNAFATGPSRSNALVAVSSGLLRAMSRTEASGVLGHEMSHVANGDMVTMTLLQGVLNTFVIFLSRVIGYFIDQAMNGGRERRDGGMGIGSFLAVFVLPNPARLPRLAGGLRLLPLARSTMPTPARPAWRGARSRCSPRCAASRRSARATR